MFEHDGRVDVTVVFEQDGRVDVTSISDGSGDVIVEEDGSSEATGVSDGCTWFGLGTGKSFCSALTDGFASADELLVFLHEFSVKLNCFRLSICLKEFQAFDPISIFHNSVCTNT